MCREVVYLAGSVRIETDGCRKLFHVDLIDDKYFGSVMLCDIATCDNGISFGGHSPHIPKEDLEYLFSLEPGTAIEVIIRRKSSG